MMKNSIFAKSVIIAIEDEITSIRRASLWHAKRNILFV